MKPVAGDRWREVGGVLLEGFQFAGGRVQQVSEPGPVLPDEPLDAGAFQQRECGFVHLFLFPRRLGLLGLLGLLSLEELRSGSGFLGSLLLGLG